MSVSVSSVSTLLSTFVITKNIPLSRTFHC